MLYVNVVLSDGQANADFIGTANSTSTEQLAAWHDELTGRACSPPSHTAIEIQSIEEYAKQKIH